MRARSGPPEIPLHEAPELVGTGGFADVWRYRHANLQVMHAVKVLKAELVTKQVLELFMREGRLMARVEHANIVRVHDAAVAADGRPYLVMEYFDNKTLADRVRSGGPLPVDRVLSIGVSLAGAVETAHRLGILHRDIKPANVLMSTKGRMALTDFGIAVAVENIGLEVSGLSIPWSPPEMFTDEGADQRADVWSLAATLYTMLTGRPPFNSPTDAGNQAETINRILNLQLPPTRRADVPASLERALARGMSKTPGGRFGSALELARELQRIEAELSLPVTMLDLAAEDPVQVRAEVAPVDDGRTRIRPIAIDAQAPETTRQRPAALPFAPGADRGTHTQLRGATAADHTQIRRPAAVPDYLDAAPHQHLTPDTEHRAEPEPTPEPAAPARRSRMPWLVAAAVAVLAIGAVLVLIPGGGAAPSGPAGKPLTVPSQNFAVVEAPPPAPAALTGRPKGKTVVFTWTNPDPKAGDYYQWRRVDTASQAPMSTVAAPAVTVADAARACLEVRLVRGDTGALSDPARACGGTG